MKLKYLMQYSASVNSVHNLLANSMMQKVHGLMYFNVLYSTKTIGIEKGEKGINGLTIIEILLKLQLQGVNGSGIGNV